VSLSTIFHTWASVITERAVDIYCDLAYELLCLSELLYRTNIEFAFLMVISQYLQ